MPTIIPYPVELESHEGSFTLTSETVIAADEASQTTARQLAAYLQPATGFALKIVADKGIAGSEMSFASWKART